MNPKVDQYLSNVGKWQSELELLREIVLSCGLTEAFKWKHPCYMFNDKNVVILHEFRDYCAISFFKGALLKNSNDLLIQPTKNIQAERQIRFTGPLQITDLKDQLKHLILEAIEVEKSGLKVKMKDTSEFEMPEELKLMFKTDPEFKSAFESLTPGRQRGYLLHFGQAKQAKTRYSRIEKNRERIYKAKGLNDCICGLSSRMPRCDGSHKTLRK